MEMLAVILLLGVCFPPWTTGTEIKRDNLIINVTKRDGNIKSLVSARTVSGQNNGNTINLSALEIDMIENGAFSELKGVKSLNLEYNRLKVLNFSFFSNLPHLEEISVTHNYITKLGGALVGSLNLKYLNLSDNNITDLGESDFEGLPKSLEITMGKSKLINVPYVDKWDVPKKLMQIFPWFHHMTMTEMHLRKAILQKRQSSEPIFVKLCKTDNDTVESVKIVAKAESFENCLSIDANDNSSILSLAHLGLRKFRREWYQIPDTFTEIDLSGNNITEITPELINDLPKSIVSVRLLSNNLTTIKRNIIDNKFLEILDLGWNSLVTIEPGAFEKTNLHTIYFSYNHLSSMDFVGTLPASLKYLILNNNKIPEIPNNCLMNLKALKHLEMKNNQLTHLSVGVFRGLGGLRYLNIDGNRLQKIEAGIFDDNKMLTIFEASDNSIEELENGVFKNAKRLRVIDLEGNKIKKISRNTFSGLHTGHLNMMSLSFNEINIIEEGSFANMTIDYFKLTGNPLTEKSAARGAFDSSKLGIVKLPNNFHINDMEYTNLARYHDFYGKKIQYSTGDIYQEVESAPKAETHFFMIIPD